MSGSLIVIAGATGFIGKALCRRLNQDGYEVAVLTRNREKAKALFGDEAIVAVWDGRTPSGWLEIASRATAVINLAGENIGSSRWTQQRKKEILDSRVLAGRAIVEAFRKSSPRPGTLIQASAVGFYGPRDDVELEENAEPGRGFLSDTVRQWEFSTQEVEKLGVRRVIIRSGLVLERDGGVLPRFLTAFRFFAGGPLGSGKQWVSWIHRQDEISAIRFLLRREDLQGVFNLVAPSPVRMKEFAGAIGRTMKRPAWFPVPGFMLRWLFGEMAEETILSGQRVLPGALLRGGYRFIFPDIEAALQQILRRKAKSGPRPGWNAG
jgi:uncharacterized protein (TIGR01777 family)